MLGNCSRRVEKIENGDEAVEANIQSSIAGIASGGTSRKLVNNEAMIGSINRVAW